MKKIASLSVIWFLCFFIIVGCKSYSDAAKITSPQRADSPNEVLKTNSTQPLNKYPNTGDLEFMQNSKSSFPYTCKSSFDLCFRDIIRLGSDTNGDLYEYKLMDAGSVLMGNQGNRVVWIGYLGLNSASASSIDLDTGRGLNVWNTGSEYPGIYLTRNENIVISAHEEGISETNLLNGDRTIHWFGRNLGSPALLGKSVKIEVSYNEATVAFLTNAKFVVIDFASRNLIFEKKIEASSSFSSRPLISRNGRYVAGLITTKTMPNNVNYSFAVWDQIKQTYAVFPLNVLDSVEQMPKLMGVTDDGNLIWSEHVYSPRNINYLNVTRLSDGKKISTPITSIRSSFMGMIFDGDRHVLAPYGGPAMSDSAVAWVDIYAETVNSFGKDSLKALACAQARCHNFQATLSNDKNRLISVAISYASKNSTIGFNFVIQIYDVSKKLLRALPYPTDVFGELYYFGNDAVPGMSSPDGTELLFWRGKKGLYWNLATGVKKSITAESNISSMHILKGQSKLLTVLTRQRASPAFITTEIE